MLLALLLRYGQSTKIIGNNTCSTHVKTTYCIHQVLQHNKIMLALLVSGQSMMLYWSPAEDLESVP
jgi:hypothetical protein